MRTLQRIWAAPAALGAATAAALTGALVFDTPVARWAACVSLAAPVAVVAWKATARR